MASFYIVGAELNHQKRKVFGPKNCLLTERDKKRERHINRLKTTKKFTEDIMMMDQPFQFTALVKSLEHTVFENSQNSLIFTFIQYFRVCKITQVTKKYKCSQNETFLGNFQTVWKQQKKFSAKPKFYFVKRKCWGDQIISRGMTIIHHLRRFDFETLMPLWRSRKKKSLFDNRSQKEDQIVKSSISLGSESTAAAAADTKLGTKLPH